MSIEKEKRSELLEEDEVLKKEEGQKDNSKKQKFFKGKEKEKSVKEDREKEEKLSRLKKKEEVRKGHTIYSLSFLVWMKVILVNVLVTLAVVAAYHFYFSPRIAIVDLTGYLINLRDLYTQGKIDQKGAQAKLDEAVNIIQKEGEKKIIFDAKVVFGKNPRVEVIKLPELPQAEGLGFNLGSESMQGFSSSPAPSTSPSSQNLTPQSGGQQ